MKKSLLLLVLILTLCSMSCSEGLSRKMVRPILLHGDTLICDYSVESGFLKFAVDGKNTIVGLTLPSILKGHFIAEVESSSKLNFGIAVVKYVDGVADADNFTSVSVCEEGGYPVVRIVDRQNGVDNVLDNTGVILKKDYDDRYSVVLSGEVYSVPFSECTGKVRIIRNDISGFFHFYFSVGKIVEGKFVENWMELAQSKDWNPKGQEFVVCPIIRTNSSEGAKTVFTNIIAKEFDGEDVESPNKFKVAERDYTWAGFPGSAVVVDFDTTYCKAAVGGRKFVFWSEMNYVPAWHMNNELLFCYEFAETWSDTVPGCFEPMSDRLLAYTTVDVWEDTKVRKTIKYHYALINPDYEGPYPDGVFPEIDEYYTFYPDGVGVRRIEFTQKKEGEGLYKYHELSEPMAISGSSTIPQEHFKEPSFIVSNLDGCKYSLYPDRSLFKEVERSTKTWSEQIYRARLEQAPDAFCVFSYSPDRPETAPLLVENDINWHNTKYQFGHWPVDKQKYKYAFSSPATWPSQVSHTSLIGVEAKSNIEWTEKYQLRENGDKYRVYLMLFGICVEDDVEAVDAHTRSWLFDGDIKELIGVDYDAQITGCTKREIVLKAVNSDEASFTIVPNGSMKNPVFRIDSWKRGDALHIKLNDKLLTPDVDYIAEMIDQNLVLWLNATLSESSCLNIR